MDPEDVGRSYDRLADHWNSSRFDRDNGISQHERAIAFIELRGAALDIGCGSSGRIIDLLLATGFEPQGIDVSPRMIELARSRHPEVLFELADIRHWQPPRRYAFVSAWDSIWHVPLKDQAAVLLKALGALESGGVMIFTTGGVDEPEERRNTLMGPPMYHAALGIPRTLAVIAQAGAVCRQLVNLAFARSAWPWSTLIVNVAGSALLGFLVYWFALRGGWWESGGRLLLATGFCGVCAAPRPCAGRPGCRAGGRRPCPASARHTRPGAFIGALGPFDSAERAPAPQVAAGHDAGFL